MRGFPKGFPPEIAVKEMDLIFVRPEYATNKRIVHWCGGYIEEGDDWTLDELHKIVLEKDNPEDLALWVDRKKNGFVLAHVDLNSPNWG